MSHDEEERSCASEWTSDSSESESSDVDDDAPCDEEEESAGSDDDSASASDGSDAVLRPPPDETPFQHAPGAPHVGRVWSPALPHLHLDTFRAFPDFLPGLLDADGAGDGGCATSSRLLTRVVRDCRVAKSVEAAADGEQYSSGRRTGSPRATRLGARSSTSRAACSSCTRATCRLSLIHI